MVIRGIVQYHLCGDEHATLIHPHGNLKKSHPYVRTMPSTLEKLTASATEKPQNQQYMLHHLKLVVSALQDLCQEMRDR